MEEVCEIQGIKGDRKFIREAMKARIQNPPKCSLYSALGDYLRACLKNHLLHFWGLVFRGLYQDDQLVYSSQN